MLWQWQATMHLNGKGYKATLEGENRDDATSSDATVRDEYVRKNGDLFREILRMLNAKSEAGKTLMLQIQDEFDNDHDGYGLWGAEASSGVSGGKLVPSRAAIRK